MSVSDRRGLGLAGLVTCLLGLAIVTPSVAGAATADQAVAYQLDAQHDGYITGSTLTAPLSQAWSTTLPGPISYPLIVNGVVYVTAKAGTTGSTTLYAINQGTGAVLWSRGLGGTDPWSGLAYDDGQVFTVNYGGELTAFDVDTGGINWSEQLPGQYEFSSAPTASGGIVYTGGAGTGGTVYAVDEGSGSLLWTASVANGDDSSPAVDGFGVYVNYAANQDYAFDPVTGAQLWHYSTGSDGGTGKTPVLGDGMVFTRDLGGNLMLDEGTGANDGSYSATPAPAVGGGLAYALDGGTLTAIGNYGLGTNAWTFSGDGDLDTAPLIIGNLVFEGSSSGNIYALNSSGQTAWSANVGSAIPAPDEQDVSQPLTGLGAGEGTLIVPAGSTLVAYTGANVGTGTPVNSVAPTVSGTPSVGELVGTDVGTWSALPTSYAYQWQRCNANGASCVNIAGATASFYAPVGGDAGYTLEVSVTATNGSGTASAVTSAASPVVAGQSSSPQPPSNLIDPAISGNAVEGDVLSASTGAWTGNPTSYSYQWMYCYQGQCGDEANGNSSTYTVQPDDIGYEIDVEVTAGNDAGDSYPDSSLPTGSVTTLGPQPVSAPLIYGTAAVGQVLTSSDGTWTGSPTGYTIQWSRCNSTLTLCSEISGATSSTYTVQGADLGQELVVSVYASNALGSSELSQSSPTVPVANALPTPSSGGGSAPLPGALLAYLTPPSISGSAIVGSTLTASHGVWSMSTATFAYQWQSCNAAGAGCVNLAGATGAQFSVPATEVGDTLSVVVTATVGARSVPVASNPTGVVALPVLSGAGSPAATAALAALGVRLGVLPRITVLTHQGLTALAHCTSTCRVTISLVATGDRGLKGTVGGGTIRVPAGQTQILTVKPSSRARATMAKLSTLTIDVVVAVTEHGSTRRYVDRLTLKR